MGRLAAGKSGLGPAIGSLLQVDLGLEIRPTRARIQSSPAAVRGLFPDEL